MPPPEEPTISIQIDPSSRLVKSGTDIGVELIAPLLIDNWTSYSFHSDFFVSPDSFTLELADDRVRQLVNKIKVGDTISLLIGDFVQCTGRLDTVDFMFSRKSGTQLHISGRDKLGLVCDRTTSPDIQNEIKPNSTYRDVFKRIFKAFGFERIVIHDNGSEVAAKSGGKEGVSLKGKSTRGKISSLHKFAKHQIKPYKNEGYMEFIHRLCNRNGWFVKLSPNGTDVLIYPPTYDRTIAPKYTLNHYVSDSKKANLNNVIEGHLKVDWTNQPSVLIMEGTSGGGQFRKSTNKVIFVNDITGYDLSTVATTLGLTDKDKNGNIIKPNQKQPDILSDGTGNIETDLKALVEKYRSRGCAVIPVNQQLVDSLPSTVFHAVNDPTSSAYRAVFKPDQETDSIEELTFRALREMYTLQNKFFSLTYLVDGHTNNGHIWTINTMVNINDEALGCFGKYWIQGVTFTKSRGGGTKTLLTIRLPYVFDYEELEGNDNITIELDK